MNTNQYETKFSIQINPNQSEAEWSDWKFCFDQSKPGLIWIENLVADVFGFIRIEDSVWINLSSDWSGFKTWFRIDSDSLELKILFGIIQAGIDLDWKLGLGLKILFGSIQAWIDLDWKLVFRLIRIEILFGLIWARIDLDWKLGFRLVQIHLDWCLGINRIKSDWFLTVFHQTRYKMFFGLDSDWLGMNFNPILWSGILFLIKIVKTWTEFEKRYN